MKSKQEKRNYYLVVYILIIDGSYFGSGITMYAVKGPNPEKGLYEGLIFATSMNCLFEQKETEIYICYVLRKRTLYVIRAEMEQYYL